MSKRILFAAVMATLAVGCGTSQSSTSTSTSGTHSSSSTGTHGTTATTGASSSGATTVTTGSSSTSATSATSATTTAANSTGSTSSNAAAANSTGSTGTTVTTNNTASSTGSTGTTSTTATTTSSSTTGTTGAACTTYNTVADARNAPFFTEACIPNVTTVYASSYGTTLADGGTAFKGNYYVGDSNGDVVNVFKNKTSGPFTYDPQPGDVVNVLGKVELFPRDGGQIEITGFPTSTLDVSFVSAGTVPTPDSISDLADLTDANSNEIGRYVAVPSQSSPFTQDNATPVFTFSTGGTTYQDGVSLSDGTHTIYVETFTYKFSGDQSCFPTDGGFPDLTAGGFNAVADQVLGDDAALHKVLFLGNCGN